MGLCSSKAGCICGRTVRHASGSDETESGQAAQLHITPGSVERYMAGVCELQRSGIEMTR